MPSDQITTVAPGTVQEERTYVRELAHRVAEAAQAPRMQKILQRWRDVNSLRTPDRAPVWCRPVGCWKEILPQDSLLCSDPWLRSLEYQFRQTLHKLDIDDDTPLHPYWEVNAAFRVEPKNLWGVEIGRHAAGVNGGAWGYAPPLEEEEDFDKLRQPIFTYDEAETTRRMEQTTELLGDILPVRLTTNPRLGATLGYYAADLRGLTEIMMDMMDEPEMLHRLMGFLRDSVLAQLEGIEQALPITPNNTGPMTCSDPLRTPEGSTWQDCWCLANSQEFDQVSPAMWEEFCLQYQLPIFERFGAVGYGCCENLTHKIDGVLKIPNLRIFTCSAWTDLGAVIEKIADRYTIMWRQKASDVVFPHETGEIRAHMDTDLARLKGCHYQIVLRELETLSGHPDRLHEWTAIAKELAAKHA